MSPVFVMPRTPADWGGAGALWLTVAGWADAERNRGGDPLILTPGGLLTIEQCLSSTGVAASVGTTRNRRGPQWARQAVRDLQRARKSHSYSYAAVGLIPPANQPVNGYVWQHHELFHTAGTELSRKFDVPLIEYVHAPVVWEARRWGVRRPGSAALLERFGERPQLLGADLVACVTEEVKQEVLRFGVAEESVVVAPMGVDLDRFSPSVEGGSWAKKTRSVGDCVVGWAGSVRRFHNLDLAIRAVCDLRSEGCSIGLVVAGDGQDRPRLEALVTELGADEWVHFVGQVPNSEMPGFLASVDLAVLTAGAEQQFHYSPLKLREYLAMGLPVVVPRVGEMARVIDDRATGLLYAPGDEKGLAAAIGSVADDEDLRRRLGEAGRSLVAMSGSWDAISGRCLAALQGARSS